MAIAHVSIKIFSKNVKKKKKKKLEFYFKQQFPTTILFAIAL